MDTIGQARVDGDARWQRLQAHAFEAPQQGIDFARRLAREQGWTLPQARRAIEEYRRYCFLACAGYGEMTPSQAVDEVWHLHLRHTRDYWERFCPQVLGMPLHHGPTRGGPAEAWRHREQYAQTLARYEQHFGLPPAEFWPAASENFAPLPRLVRVDRSRYWLIPRPRWRVPAVALAMAALASAGFGGAALAANPLDWSGGAFLQLYVILLGLALAASLLLRWILRDTRGARAAPAGTLELAYLAGGPQRCVDAGVAQLLAEGKVDWDRASARLRLKEAAHAESPPLDWIAHCIAADGRPAKVLARAVVRLQPVRDALIAKGLWLDPGTAWRVRFWSALPTIALLAFGGAKIAVGIARERPVTYLLILSVISALIALGLLLVDATRTRAGEHALAEARERHARLLRAPRGSEIGLAVAMLGTIALAGTAWAGYHEVRAPGNSGSEGSSGGSDSSSGGDGGGSGGCGGCGGGD